MDRTSLNREVEPIWVNNVVQATRYLETTAADATKLPRLILADLYLPRREDGLLLLEFINTCTFYRWAWWLTPEIPDFGRLRQEDRLSPGV